MYQGRHTKMEVGTDTSEDGEDEEDGSFIELSVFPSLSEVK